MSKLKKGILERLREGPVVGDGSYVFTLEKRGYVKAGEWTPEAVIEYPDAVRQLHRDFLRAGADVIQAFTFYSSGDKLKSTTGNVYQSHDVNAAACNLALEVAGTGDAVVCGGISPTPTYMLKKGGKEAVQAEFQKQLDVFQQYDVDFVLAEFFPFIEEMEWAIEVLKKSGKPVAATMRIGPIGDLNGVLPGDCAVRMAKAGADIVGLNCSYDYRTCLKTMTVMKEALNAHNLHPFLMLQPNGYHCPEVENDALGSSRLPEHPFAVEPRIYTRWDVREYTRKAYDLGVHYIGGCCGFEPYHIREIAEELAEERGKRPPGADKNGLWGSGYKESMFTYLRERSTKEYWTNVKPSFGRPDCPVLGKPVQKKE